MRQSLYKSSLLILVVVCVTSCSTVTRSPLPFYREPEVVYVPEIAGEWTRQDGHTTPYPRRWAFVKGVSTNYVLSISDSRIVPDKYNVVFFKRDDSLYADLDDSPASEHFYARRSHTLWKIEFKEDCLTLASWFGNPPKLPKMEPIVTKPITTWRETAERMLREEKVRELQKAKLLQEMGSITNGVFSSEPVVLANRKIIPKINFTMRNTVTR